MEQNNKNKLNDSVKKRAAIALMGVGISTSLLSGKELATLSSSEQQIEYTMDDDKVYVPWEYKDQLSGLLLDKDNGFYYTAEDAEKVSSISLTLRTDNLGWLKKFQNLKSLCLIVNADSDFKSIDSLPDFDYLEKLMIINVNQISINFDSRFNSVKNIDKIDSLALVNFMFDSPMIYSLYNVDELDLGINCDTALNYRELLNFKIISFSVDQPYNIAIGFTRKDYDYLVKHGVTVISTKKALEEALGLDKQLNEIVSTLKVDKNSNDQEKLDAILIYVLDNLKYDEDVALYSSINVKDDDMILDFYKRGYLYSVFNRETSICGNYASLFTALANRVGLKSKLLLSDNHAWNLVTIDNEDYYVDATWLDIDEGTSQSIKAGKTDKLEWYMKDPEMSDSLENILSHMPSNLVKEDTYISLSLDVENGEKKDKNYFINIKNKRYKVSLALVVGLLCAFGGAICLTRNNKKIEIPEEEVGECLKIKK